MRKNYFKLLIVFCLIVPVMVFMSACGGDNGKNTDKTNAPTQDYIVECLQSVPGILDVQAVTEATDKNNLLNKSGGYYASIYFSYSLVNQNDIIGTTIIDKGVDAGGCVEAYKTKEEAEKRRDYLASFDGTFLATGTHKVVGTLVVRTSNQLIASQQNLLETNIIYALKGQNDKIDNNIGSSSGSSNTETINYGTYFMEKNANSNIYISNDNTVSFYDAFDDFNLQGHTVFTYTYIPANSEDYDNIYPMLEIDMSVLNSSALTNYGYIHILDESTIMYNGERFSN